MSAQAFDAWQIDPTTIAIVLTVIAIVSMARLVYRQWRAEPAQRSRAWRVALLVVAQPVCAALLYFALLPPTTPGEAGTLVVAGAGASAAQWEAGRGGDAVVALPEAPSLPGVERVPDLGTALRRHPGMQRIRVFGAGLEARDRDAARGHALAFEPAPLPRGLVEVDVPSHAVAGSAFRLAGRAQDLRGGFAELLDPGGQRVDRVALADDGRFTLGATTRVAGAAVFQLRVRDAGQRVIEQLALPMQVESEPAPRVLLLAGAPGPEVKYLRRWARDAGLPMHAQIGAGGGMQVGDAPIGLNAGSLARFDIVVLDERAWIALGDTQRAALNDAVRGGLGVLLRVTAALPEAERRRPARTRLQRRWRTRRHRIRLARPRADDDALRARMGPGSRDAPRRPDAAIPETPALTRRMLQIDARDAVPLLRDDKGQPLAVWRAEGRGRIAVWPLTDTYRLVLAGRGDLHGDTWSAAIATLARAQPGRPFAIEGELRQGERVALCGIAQDARVVGPDGAALALRIDPATGTRACAAYWPKAAGWHRLQSGARGSCSMCGPPMRARDCIRTWCAKRPCGWPRRRRARSEATRAALPVPRHPGARWPWWLAWLLASAAVWWLERSRAGRVG
jgi:hypothetical protein